MEKLTREKAICRHRLMWNWIAGETEKTGEPISKGDAFKHFGWDESKVLSSCWCCEWAYRERNLDLYKDNYKSFCFYCPLDWSNGEKEILKATCSTITSNDGHTKDGLYDQWCFGTSLPGDPIKASRLARIIANLPEKKEVKGKMIDISKTRVSGFEAAIRGMRNPLESWERSDSKDEIWYDEKSGNVYDYHVGENDLVLMKTLAAAGDDHGKFARFIHVSADILAPRYWWTEYDTYKVGTASNSCSTMHCIHKKEFTFDDFSHDRLGEIEAPNGMNCDFSYTLKSTIFDLNVARTFYLETGDKEYWYAMIQLLPQSYNQKRTVDLNYQVLWKMYKARKDHKIDEWHTFCDWVKSLPYFCEIYGI